MKILITGGAGFVGSALARHFLADSHSIVVLDNLRRQGSETNVANLVAQGAAFVHGDVRHPADMQNLEGNFDVLIEASAEPSVRAGIGGSPRYVLDTNLLGAMNCLEFARERCGGLVFLSSSRVYSVAPLRSLPLVASASRLDIASDGAVPGVGLSGVRENFACDSARSFYGASKLAAELLCQEYAEHAGLKVVINRCGVIAGPGQFGKTDQGVFTLWVARHHFGRPLKYTGFGGKGLQVRDLLHPQDLCELVTRQLQSWDKIAGGTFNVGGGRDGSVSLQEFTLLCQQVVGREVPIAADATTSPVDIPWYISDNAKVTALLNWTPTRRPREIARDIATWVEANELSLSKVIV
ncbi:MAG: 3-beta hydroxysteroid dehydrogenase [Frankiales bacterium]|nr:3-beta hydroxysteroid dehydrogenase [Frankiales bacterium]